MNKTMDKYILIVEGKNDYSRIKQIFPEMNILITGGSAVSEEFLKDVKVLSKTHKIVIFTDPDYPGEKIRKKIMEVVPEASHVFISKSKAISKNNKKVGVEHAKNEEIKIALNHINNPINQGKITFNELYDMGLVGDGVAKVKRMWLCEKLNIGYVNAKQLNKRLSLFGYDIEKIKEILNDR